jgi:hypothetical protein
MLSALAILETVMRPPVVWIIGERGTLGSTLYPYSKYCEIWNAQKEMVHRGSVCGYTQDFVTEADNGNWTFVVGIDGKLLEERIVQEIIVTKSKGTRLL